MVEDSDSVSVVNEFTKPGSDSIDTGSSGCANDLEDSMSWTYATAILSDSETENIVVPSGEFTNIYIQDLFSNPPEDLLSGCKSSFSGTLEPTPDSVSYSITVPDDNVVSLADPVPQPNDSNPDNDYDDLATIGIAVAKAFVGSWASVALTGIKVILSREVGDPINFDRDTVGSGERFTWSYLLDGSSGMDGIPTSREETAGVRASLLNRNLGSGDFSDVTVNSSFTFRYPSLGGYCPCEDFVYVNETSENSFIELVEG